MIFSLFQVKDLIIKNKNALVIRLGLSSSYILKEKNVNFI